MKTFYLAGLLYEKLVIIINEQNTKIPTELNVIPTKDKLNYNSTFMDV